MYELSADHSLFEMAELLGLPVAEMGEIAGRVFDERGTPNLVAARQAIEALGRIRLV